MAIWLCEDDVVVAKPSGYLFIYVRRFSDLFTCFILSFCLDRDFDKCANMQQTVLQEFPFVLRF